MRSTRRIAVMMDLDKILKRHVGTFAGIQDYAQQAGWHLVINDWADRMLPARSGQPSPYDGLIGRITTTGANRAKRLDLPVVNVWFNSPSRKALPGVFPDFTACGREYAEHLLSRGFQNLGILTHADDQGMLLETSAFQQAAREADCRQLLPVVLGTKRDVRMGIGALDLADYADWKQAMQIIQRWMDQWTIPIGLFVFDVTIARLIIEQCEDRGWRIPEDVAIVAGMNDEAECELPRPSISSLELPNAKIGYEAARLLDELLDEKNKRGTNQKRARTDHSEPKTILLPPVGVVPRHSTDFFAVDDDVVREALTYIQSNLSRAIVIDDIAEHVHVSRATLTTRFRKKLGRSIGSELQRLRLERVKRELTNSETPIYQIADAAGYGDVRSLNAVFRKVLGCTPREYRKQSARERAN